MSKKQVGVGCFVFCFVALFVAFERYQNNANAVAAIQSSPLGGMMQSMVGTTQLKPATPAATKYALFAALLTGAAGIYCFASPDSTTSGRARNRGRDLNPDRGQSPQSSDQFSEQEDLHETHDSFESYESVGDDFDD